MVMIGISTGCIFPQREKFPAGRLFGKSTGKVALELMD